MKLHLLTRLTVLPTPEDRRGDAEIVEEWARGLEWVNWLLGSVRARSEHVVLNGGGWQGFTEGAFRQTVGPALEKAWSAAHAGDLPGLLAADALMSEQLSAAEAQRSIQAGAVLLKSTRKARYQGVLGHFRDRITAGASPGHLATVWAAVGHLFHLSLANVIAEYLRLEWEISTRRDAKRVMPNFSRLTSDLLLGRMSEPRVL